MKTCPFCAEEILDAAVKCRFCGEWIGKKKGRLLGCLAWSLGAVTLIVAVGYSVAIFMNDHGRHGHNPFEDPIHVLGLIVVVIGAVTTWRGLTRHRRSQ